MDDSRVLRGIELRYALTEFLAQHGPTSITGLIDGLTWQGFVIHGDPPNSVSDGLRWERRHARVRRLGLARRSIRSVGGQFLLWLSAGAQSRGDDVETRIRFVQHTHQLLQHRGVAGDVEAR
ncbi:hypothetical protein BH09ACT8_BH09ACT8_17240 [soil metagenome]